MDTLFAHGYMGKNGVVRINEIESFILKSKFWTTFLLIIYPQC